MALDARRSTPVEIRWSPEEFRELQEPWDEKMRAVADERMATLYRREKLENFTEDEAAVMRAALDRLIPQDEGIDLAGFVDANASNPLGRGDKPPGMPESLEVIRIGLRGLEEAAQIEFSKGFLDLDGAQQDDLLGRVQHDEAPGAAWKEVPGKHFFETLYRKALTGYLAHPLAWMRIGFMGASFPEGYAWISKGQVKQRRERAAGWEEL